MEQSENNPNPIVEESTDDLFMVPTRSTRDLIEQAIGETDRLYMNALGITDSLARRVITGLATDILTTLRSAESTLPAEVPRVSYHEGAVTISTVEWQDEAEDTMFKRPLVESDFTVTGNSEGDEPAEKSDLKGIRNMLNLAQNEYEKAMKGMPRYGPSLALAAAVDTAVEYLGDFTEQAIHPLTPVAELIEASDRIDAEGDEDSPSIADELEDADLEGWN